MKNILIVIGHPYWKDSVANKAIVNEFSLLCPSLVSSNISVLYPDGKTDVAAEQKKLLNADIIILQYPFMWFGCPSTMHAYMEQVLTYGFAYGKGGESLKGKHIIASITTGAPESAYSKEGHEGVTIDELMTQVSATAVFCGMKYDGYVYSCGMATAGAGTEQVEQVKIKAADHAKRLAQKINSL